MLPETTSTPNYIIHFGALHPSTSFEDVLKKVPSSFPELQQVIVFSNVSLVISGKEVNSILQERYIFSLMKFTLIALRRFLDYVLRYSSMGSRKHFVTEFQFRKLTRTNAGMQIQTESKFLIAALPDLESHDQGM